jgi:hypothetical protein
MQHKHTNHPHLGCAPLGVGQKVRLVDEQQIALGRVHLGHVCLEVRAPKEKRVARVYNLHQQITAERVCA